MQQINNKELIRLAHAKMPFGKYKGRYLVDLPEPYLVWFKNQGFPKGVLGEQLMTMFEVKRNGLETIIRNIQAHYCIESIK